jgi:hypothetical protein
MKTIWLCVLLVTTAVACSGKEIGVNTPEDTSTDAASDQNTADDASLDQNTQPDLPGDMTADVSDMQNADQGADTADAADAPDASLPVDLSCGEHADCGRCVFPTAPKTIADCYCTACDTAVLPVALCQANQAEWERVCGNDDTWQSNGACPQVRCVMPKPIACINDVCIDACAQAFCPTLACPLNEQVIPAGECCARCSGPNTCQDDSECSMCSHPNVATQPSECQCPLCPTYPTTQTECQDRAAGFTTHCDADFIATCPVALCLPGAPANCGDSGYCEQSTFRCQSETDCGYCPFSVAPKNASECVCEGCGAPMTTDECSAIMQQVNSVCAGFDFDSCLAPPCARPPDLSCDFNGGVCVPVL